MRQIRSIFGNRFVWLILALAATASVLPVTDDAAAACGSTSCRTRCWSATQGVLFVYWQATYTACCSFVEGDHYPCPPGYSRQHSTFCINGTYQTCAL